MSTLQATLAESPRSFEVLLERLPAGAYTCDGDGLITWFNEAAVRVWGREPKLNDPVDRYCGSFRLYDSQGTPLAHEDCWMALALRENKAQEGREIVIERPDGARVQVLAYARPIHDDAGTMLGAVNVLVDVSERKRAERALRHNQDLLDDFFETAAVGLHWVGGDGTILRVNQAELDMLGYRREDYLGHNIAEFHVDADTIKDMLSRLAAGETLRDRDARMRHRDGSIREVQICSNALFDESGELVHTRCFTIDVTLQKRAERRLQEADRRKNEFLAMLAHELRNPLAPIRNAVELLRFEGPPVPVLDQARDLIERQVAQMTRLVDDLLDVARITRGKLGVRLERVSLDAVVKSALETVRPLVDENQHELIVELPADPVMLDADPVRLAQVFVNLIGNAARYTARGGRIELRAQIVENGAAPRVRTSVRDNGRGMRADEVGQMFDMFTQGKDSETGHPGAGLGIGLTLVKALVELHGGSVVARSAGPSQGSEFVVEVPIATLADQSEVPSHRTRAGVQNRQRVLVVDDNQDAALSLSLLLQSIGHEVATAHCGMAAVEMAARFQPDVCLLDIGLPDIDGYETCRRIRAQAGSRRSLLIAITGWGESEHKKRAQEAGFDHHLTKPVEPERIRELIDRADSSRPPAIPAPPPTRQASA